MSALGDLTLSERGGELRVAVIVKPRSSRSAILGAHDGALSVALNAPPVDGAANAELVKLLARALSVRKSDVTIASGQTGRRKLVDISGIDAATFRARVAAVL